MAAKIMDHFRGSRKVEWFAAAAFLALILLIVLNGQTPDKTTKTDLELRLESTLSCVNGIDSINAMITEKEDGTIAGILIVAAGDFGIKTQIEMQKAVETLLDIEINRISIIKND